MRRGFSLIELLAVLTVASAVFTAIGVAMYGLHRTQRTVEDEMHTAVALSAFAQRLREDAHAANDFALAGAEAEDGGEPAEPTLRLVFADGRSVEYRYHAESARIRRRVIEGEKTTHGDSFALPPDSEVRWSATDEGEAPVMAVLVERPVGAGPPEHRGRRVVRIEAAVGLTRHWRE